LCRACGEILKCPNCDVALTFHLSSRHLICHYCGYSTEKACRCSACRCEAFKAYGFGTERLEEEIAAQFPTARTARMDADSTRRKGEVLRLLKKFSAGEIDILIGTQMITKGFDFPAVTLVGVVASDLSLGFPDFRAAERTFHLLSQVAGRAGRGEKPGRVIIQTFNPSHYALAAAVGNDYDTFLQKEIKLRSSLGYPPFRYMAILRLQGNRKKDTAVIAAELSDSIRRSSACQGSERGELKVLGPVEAPLSKLKGKYRFQIMIKASHPFIIQGLIRRVLASVKAELSRNGVECIVDMDPYQML
jgi:primosomal protein N' (replication factor Y)